MNGATPQLSTAEKDNRVTQKTDHVELSLKITIPAALAPAAQHMFITTPSYSIEARLLCHLLLRSSFAAAHQQSSP